MARRALPRFTVLELFLVVAVLMPVEMEVGTSVFSASVPLALLVCVTWFLRQLLVRRRLGLYPSRIVIATAAFMAIAVLAFLVGQFPWFGLPGAPIRAQFGGLAVFLLSGGLLLVVGHDLGSVRHLQRVTWLFIGAGTLVMLLMVAHLAEVAVGRLVIARSDSIGSLFYVWLVALSAGQALWNPRLTPVKRGALFAIAFLTPLYQMIFLTSWASGWVPALVALGAVFLLRFPKVTVAAAILVAPLALYITTQGVESLMPQESYSRMTRLEAARVLGRIIKHSPIIGFGPANYHFYTPLVPILGYRVRFNSHNQYIDLVAQAGLLGLVAFFWIVAELLRLALRLTRRHRAGFEKAYAMGVLGGCVGTVFSGLLGDWIVPFVYNVGIRGMRSSLLFWVFAGGLVALDRLFREAQRAAAPPPRPVWAR